MNMFAQSTSTSHSKPHNSGIAGFDALVSPKFATLWWRGSWWRNNPPAAPFADVVDSGL